MAGTPDRQPINQWQSRDAGSAEHVARRLRRSGCQVARVPADRLPPPVTIPTCGFAPGLGAFAPNAGTGAAAAPLWARQA